MDIFTQCCCYMSIKWNNFLVIQELQKMFNDSDSFFYSPTGDLTNTLQRQFSGKYNAADPVWKRVSNVHPCTCTPVCAKFINGLVITAKHGVLCMYIIIREFWCCYSTWNSQTECWWHDLQFIFDSHKVQLTVCGSFFRYSTPFSCFYLSSWMQNVWTIFLK